MTKEILTQLWNSSYGQLRVAAMMSGSGSNVIEIARHENLLKRERGVSPFHVAAIFTNRYDSKAPQIGHYFDIPVLMRDDRGFSRAREKKLNEVREEFDYETVKALCPYRCRVAALGGYMLFTSRFIYDYFLSVNVHPADLSIVNSAGERRYTGDKAVKLALEAHESELRSTTHILDDKPDHGPILMISDALPVKYPINETPIDRVADAYQNRLKERGDWVIFPKTLEYIADGRYAKDSSGKLYFDGKAIPKGITFKGEVRR